MTRRRFTPRPSHPPPAAMRRPGEGVRTTGIRAWGQVDTRVDRQSPPAIFRRLRDLSVPASIAKSPCGGIGRRARLKIEFRKECWFDSGQGHHRILFPVTIFSNQRAQRKRRTVQIDWTYSAWPGREGEHYFRGTQASQRYHKLRLTLQQTIRELPMMYKRIFASVMLCGISIPVSTQQLPRGAF